MTTTSVAITGPFPAGTAPKRAGVYLRRSTSGADQTHSLPDQLKEIRRGAKDLGIEIDEELIFVDDGVSGTSLKLREGANRMLEAARSGAFAKRGTTYLLYWCTDRLSRRTMDALALESELLAHGILPYSVSENYDLSSPGGHLEFVLRAAFAELQNKLRTFDIQRGIRRAVRAGVRVSPRAFGYEHVDDDLQKARLRPHHAEAEFVPKIFRWVNQGYGPWVIAQRLEKLGAPTVNGGRWGPTTIRNIIRNEVYIGVTIYGRQSKTTRSNPLERFVVEPYTHPPLVGILEFLSAQTIMNDRSRLRRFTSTIKNEYLLSGLQLLQCGVCGAHVIGMAQPRPGGKQPPYTYYACSTRKRGHVFVATTIVDEAVLEAVRGYARSPGSISSAWQRHRRSLLPRVGPLRQKLAEIDRALVSNGKYFKRIMDAYQKARVGKDALGQRLAELSDEKTRLSTDRVKQSASLATEEAGPDEKVLLAQLNDFDSRFAACSLQEKKMLIRCLISKILIHEPLRIEITAKFIPDKIAVSPSRRHVILKPQGRTR